MTRVLFRSFLVLAVLGIVTSSDVRAAESEDVSVFHKKIEPILDRFCSDCHAAGSSKGKVSFDRFESASPLEERELWSKTLKMLRAELMPPKGKPRPTAQQLDTITQWIKGSVFRIDPKDPDPGRVTVRRLNRIEYRNTIRDLMGVDYNTDATFPPDDTGHGFDNLGDVLSLSPLLLEKYITAARAVVSQAVPVVSWVPAEKRIPGRLFAAKGSKPAGSGRDDFLSLSYYKPAVVSCTFSAEHTGRYQLIVDLSAKETYVDGVSDHNKCRLIFKSDGKVLLDRQFTRQGNRDYRFEFDKDWKNGPHEWTFELQPLTPNEKQVRSLTLRIEAVTARGPIDNGHGVRPRNYARFFPEGVPDDPARRRQTARTILRNFATRAYRRPVDEETVERLAKLAERVSIQGGRTFEAGIAQAITIILSSPRFLFREEGVVPGSAGTHPLVDEYALASRLSYFLWSSMPDEELFRLAGENKLRANLDAQVARMRADPRASEFVRHFVGQWLQARAIESIDINARAVIVRDEPPDPEADKQRERLRALFRKPPEKLTEAEKKEMAEARRKFFGRFGRFRQFELNGQLRKAMRQETEMLFRHVLNNDRSLLELIESDYTFLNARLAKQYGIEGVQGDEMRLVKLAADSPRGGVLTQGTVLAVTSNPDRTSPVKRGLFILDNILGTPPPPPPPDIPALEDAEAGIKGRPATLRETLKAHRAEALCSACHNRMDPLGLALENFNALGRWRDKERGQPIEAAGQLLTGESFSNVRELKHILATKRRLDFYRCLTEKMLVYALGRGLEYADEQTVDEIVERLEKTGGRPSVLLTGIISSAPFQKRRATGASESPGTLQGASLPPP